MLRAARLFYLLAVVKAVGVFLVLRVPRPHATLFIVWFAAGIALSLLIGVALQKRLLWARTAGVIYAGAHALGILAAPLMGVGVLVSGVIGIAALSALIREKES